MSGECQSAVSICKYCLLPTVAVCSPWFGVRFPVTVLMELPCSCLFPAAVVGGAASAGGLGGALGGSSGFGLGSGSCAIGLGGGLGGSSGFGLGSGSGSGFGFGGGIGGSSSGKIISTTTVSKKSFR